MKNTVELIGFYGSDEVIACSAWTSTSRNLTDEKISRIPQLLETLWSAGHHTPFEKGGVHFLVDTDIATHIHLLKHRISSMNAESARYKELKEDKYYIPADWSVNRSSENWVKFGNADAFNWQDTLIQYTELGNRLYHSCLADLTPVLGRKRAKESARYFKTYNSKIQADVFFNLRSFANLQNLRNDEHAQKEVREVAQEMIALIENIPQQPFQHTLKVMSMYKQRMVKVSE